MKKIMIFGAFAALISLASTSCQKESLNEAVKDDPSAAPATESPVFTATISAGSKTTLNAESGKVSWEDTDEITVTGKSATAKYNIAYIDENGRAVFAIKPDETNPGDGPYTATYGTAPATAQTYSDSSVNLYMTAQSSTTSLTFTVQCGLMEINLTKTDEYVKSIAVIGTPTGTGGTEITYTLTCTEPQSIAAERSFYISVPAGSYNKIVITDSEDKVCTLTAASGITVEANHIKPLTFAGSKLNFKSNLPAGALPGVFTVADDGKGNVKKVHFSKGNLFYDGKNWGFEAEQYYFRTYRNKGKCDAEGYNKDSGTATSHWGLFGWVGASSTITTSPKIYGASNSTTTSQYGNVSGEALKADWGKTIDDNGTWTTLTGRDNGEWKYLFDHHVNVWGTCNNVPGRFIAPDDFEGDAAALISAVSNWASAQAAGIVFLPAAGYRSGSNVNYVGNSGYYWSSTAGGESDASSVSFYNPNVNPFSFESRTCGFSVRLITEAK